MPREKLSVVILTKNAEDCVRSCLDSVTWVDEIVVIDAHSSDATVAICREYTDKIIESDFKGFAEERNLGIDNSSGDWILQLDADEIVTAGLKEAIGRVLDSSGECVSYKFRRKNYFLGHPMRYGGWYHYSAHFFKRGFARYEGLVHERLKVNGRQGMIEAEVEHRPFKSMAQFMSRQNRYTGYEARDLLAEKGILDERIVFKNLYIKPMKLFWKMYVKKQGFREGRYGLIFSLMYSFVHVLKWAKYWELTYGKEEK